MMASGWKAAWSESQKDSAGVLTRGPLRLAAVYAVDSQEEVCCESDDHTDVHRLLFC